MNCSSSSSHTITTVVKKNILDVKTMCWSFHLLLKLFNSLPYILILYLILVLSLRYFRELRLHAAIKLIPGPSPHYPLIGNLDLFWDKHNGLNFSKYQIFTHLLISYINSFSLLEQQLSMSSKAKRKKFHQHIVIIRCFLVYSNKRATNSLGGSLRKEWYL